MGLLVLKKTTLLLIIISASMLSASFAGRQWKYMDEYKMKTSSDAKELPKKRCKEDSIGIHERVLKVNTKDYGSYEPAPTFRKPPFKLIPN
ncbi:protein CASPARIAN STRIP INTEGRITY FACTOR 1 [Cinnamomum micranthum f. kanehirae]|uniref:Protein CASPARIAN STRIP INTEGRITY FACTOR 1 n=1 Tax=Cinnamomum micranthum f. kanehirae TaxID=337451 RepID=A0A3S3N7Y2_9MAGN|nr:protein CASPARIAN STRIP INTEGRITY FACTOR 1 [Cinnamomum micranthum f. kanehirae]